MCFLIAVQALQNVLVYKRNRNGAMTYYNSLGSNGTLPSEVGAATTNIMAVVGGDNRSYILTNDGLYVVGAQQTHKKPGKGLQQVQRLEHLRSQVIDISASATQTTVLTDNNEVYTVSTTKPAKSRRGTPQMYFASQRAYKSEKPIIQVGSVRNLSYIVHQDAIRVMGKCEYGLCGAVNGTEINAPVNDWIQIDLSAIPDPRIQHVYFGTEQIIVQTEDSRYYYLGKNANKQACNTTETVVSVPSQMPFQSMGQIKANENVTAGIDASGRVLYCGCIDSFRCTKGHYTQPVGLQVVGNRNIVDLGINGGWIVVSDAGVVSSSRGNGVWNDLPLPQEPEKQQRPNRLTETGQLVMLYRQPRGLAIMVDKSCTVVVGSTPVRVDAEVEKVVELGYAQHPAWSKSAVSIDYPGYARVDDSVTLTNGLVRLRYSLTQTQQITLTVNAYTDANVKVTTAYVLLYQLPDKNILQVADISSNNKIVLKQNSFMLNRNYVIKVTDTQGRYFPVEQEIILNDVVVIVNIKLQTTKEYQFILLDQRNQPISNLQIAYTMNSMKVSATTNTDGAVKVNFTLEQVNKRGGFTIRIQFPGNGVYEQYDNTTTWEPSYQDNITFQLRQQTGYRLDIILTNSAQGKFLVRSPIKDQCYTEVTVTTAQTYQITLDSNNCNVQLGDNLIVEYIDISGVYYAPSKTIIVAFRMFVVYQLLRNDHMITFMIKDQNMYIASQYQFKVTHNNKTFSTLITDNNGQANVTMKLAEIHTGSRKIYLTGDEQTNYRALSVIEVPDDQLQNEIAISVYKYGTVSITITASDAAHISIPNLVVKFIRESDGSEVFSETTDALGKVYYKVGENRNIVTLGTSYKIVISDPRGLYKEYQTTYYVTQLSNTVRCIINAQKLYLRVIDTINNVEAAGAQVTLHIGQHAQTRSSDSSGRLEFDVPQDLQGVQLGFSVAGSDVYKPVARQSFTYSTDQVTLYVQTYLNFSLTVTIQDGNTDQPVEGLQATIFTMPEGVEKAQAKTNALGQFLLRYSEKDSVFSLNTVYKMEITDPHNRYSTMTYNYSVVQPNQSTVVKLNLQVVHVTLINIDTERVPNVTVVLYANGAEIGREVTNALGFACFYLKDSEYLGKQLTYKTLRSDLYRAAAPKPVPITTHNQTQYAVRMLFPLVVFRFNVRLVLSEAEEGEYEESAIVAEGKLQNFEVSFLDKNGTVLHRMPVSRLGRLFNERFVENINQSFRINGEYRLLVRDLNGVYRDIERNFTLSDIRQNFTLRLTPRPPERFNIPFYGAIMLAAGLLGLWFIVYAHVQLWNAVKRIKREVPQQACDQNANQIYMNLIQENLNMILLRQDQEKAHKHMTLLEINKCREMDDEHGSAKQHTRASQLFLDAESGGT